MPILNLINESYALKLSEVILFTLAQLYLRLCYFILDSTCVSDCVLQLSILFLKVLDELLIVALEFLAELYVFHS